MPITSEPEKLRRVLLEFKVGKWNIKQEIRTVLFCTVSIVLAACTNREADKSQSNKKFTDSSSAAIQHTDTFTGSSLPVQKDEQAKIYVQAIAEYIKAGYEKDKTRFDTLFFGKHNDFPNIELRATIANRKIMLLTADEADEKRKYRDSLVYINLFGWVTKADAQFIFVTFFPEYQHRYDYFIDFTYDTKRKEFGLEKIQFENYFDSKGEKPERLTISHRHSFRQKNV